MIKLEAITGGVGMFWKLYDSNERFGRVAFCLASVTDAKLGSTEIFDLKFGEDIP